jgi:hypothetical protein
MSVDDKIVNNLKERKISYEPYNYSLKEKKEISDELKKIIQENQPQGNLTEKNESNIDGLKESGYLKFKDKLLSSEQVDDILDYLKNKNGYPLHIAYYDKYHPVKNPFDYKGKILSFSPDTIFNAPHLVELISSDKILEPVVKYFGVLPAFFDVNIVISNGSESKTKYHETQHYHRDHDDFHHVLLMVYLTDVGEEDGPHIYAKGTHKLNSKSAELKPKVLENNTVVDLLNKEERFTNQIIEGEKGSGFLTDATGLHAGSVPAKNKRRIMFWARFGISKNYMWEHHNHRWWGYDNNLFFKKIENYNDEKKFVFRLFAEDYDKEYWRKYKTRGDGCMRKTVYKKWNVGILNNYYYAMHQSYGPIALDDIFFNDFDTNIKEFHKFCDYKKILYDKDDLILISKIDEFETNR